MPLIRRTVLSPERRNPCTHMTMTRLYDPYGSFKCSLCHKHPTIGWLYCCTQDTGGVLPESDFTDEPSLRRSRLGQDVATHSLSSSVIKAIGQAHYTGDELKKLIQQKERVRDLVLSQYASEDGRPPTSSTFSTASSSSSDGDCTFSTIPQSTTVSTNSSTSLDEEIKQAYDWKELQKVWMSEPSMAPPEPRVKSLPPAHLHPQPVPTPEKQPCTFKICPTCRPTYRERAYQSLEYVLNNPVRMPPIWELENRRVSDARTVAGIGLSKLPQSRFYAQTDPAALQSSRTIPGIIVDNTDAEEDCQNAMDTYLVEDNPQSYQHNINNLNDTHTIRKRSGFRQTVRKALARARHEDSASTSSHTNSSEYGGDSQPQPELPSRPSSRSLIFRRRRSRSSTLSFVETPGARVVDTSPLQDSVMLMLATNTPLPRTPSVGGFHLGPGVDDGHGQESIGNGGSNFQTTDVISQS